MGDESGRRVLFNEGFNAGLQKGRYDGYKEGLNSARSNLLMKMCEWLDIRGSGINPCWLAHVATMDFKCGCELTSDCDGTIESVTCEMWDNSTAEQQVQLFENVYGYSYDVYLLKQKQEQERRDRLHQAQIAREIKRTQEEIKERFERAGVPPELLP
jgi:flagellar biosynthesis/type III secretory pathway protein FliH